MRSKMILMLSIVLVSLVIFNTTGSAHPGRTDSNGGHTCRTNCAKWGLKDGEYHYHSGKGSNNSSSSSSSSSSSTESSSKSQAKSTSKKQKPTYTQQDIDNGKVAGKSSGFDDGYKRLPKSITTTVGNEGYQKGYTEGYELGYSEGLKKIKTEDEAKGKVEGEKQGEKDYLAGKTKDSTPHMTESEDWNNAFKIAYISAYDKEKKLFEADKAGYELGYSLEELVVPPEFEDLNDEFEKAYEKGFNIRMEEEKNNYIELGKNDGYLLVTSVASTLDERFVDFYLDGYGSGQNERKNEIFTEGYESAFINMEFKSSSQYDSEPARAWYHEGFESNEIAIEIKAIAYENGYTNKKYFIPKEFKVNDLSINLYDTLFNSGQEEKQEEIKLIRKKVISSAIVVLGAGMGGAFLYRKRYIKTKV